MGSKTKEPVSSYRQEKTFPCNGKLLIRLFVSSDMKGGELLPRTPLSPITRKEDYFKGIIKNTFCLAGTTCARACTQGFAWISHWPSFCSEERQGPYEDPGNATGSAHTSQDTSFHCLCSLHANPHPALPLTPGMPPASVVLTADCF